MTEVLFYHLTESKLVDALPPILEKSVERGWAVIVQATNADLCTELDAHLWTFRDDSFLPHGLDNSDNAASQPVLLTTSTENLNEAKVRIFIDGAIPENIDSYQRAVLMFDGFDAEQTASARLHWKALKDQGHQLTYWQQTPEGRWQKKA